MARVLALRRHDRLVARAMTTLDEDELGLAYLITTDRILATIGGILGGATICLGLLIRYSRHLNQTSKEHRP